MATVLTMLIGLHWAGGAVHAFLVFIPNAFGYLLVFLHFNSKKKLQVLVLMLLFVCLFVIAHGGIEMLHGLPQSPLQTAANANGDLSLDMWDAQHAYLTPMRSDTGTWFYRLRGLGDINDPNDFGQLIVCVIPLMFIFWRAKKMFRNFVFVILPVCALFYGLFLTHSRGALLALIAMAVVAARRRIGTLRALLVAVVLFVAATALHFTGGRDISADSGADRTVLWGEGLQIVKTHPLFGVGLGNMKDYTDEYLTAHNSVIVCAAELGMFGLFFWCLFLLPTVRDALIVASPAKVDEGEPIVPKEELYPQSAGKIDAIDKAEINHLGQWVVLSLTGFLVAGFFLSRAFVTTFFLLGGVTEVVFEMALQRGMIAPRLPLALLLRYAGILTVSLIPLMYILIRILNLMH
jgi:hypothetical protein